MSKSIPLLAMLVALAASMPALAQNGERDTTYPSPSSSSWSGFRYRPLAVQIEGGETFTTGTEGSNLHGGYNLGLGLTWQPLSWLPLALRADGMYGHFHDRPALLAQAAARLGTAVDWGDTDMWGGDLDVELDTVLAPRVRLYFLAGAGGYDIRERFYQRGIVNGVFCGYFYCFSGPALASYRVGESTTGMRFEKNAGAGLEFALGGDLSLFVDARYMRFDEDGQHLDFIPVRIGLRF